jgi:ParB/RepB/Spo0J family partition protein
MTTTTPDIVGTRARVNPDATKPDGNRHPFAGICGIVTGERRGGTLKLEIHGNEVQLDGKYVTLLGDDELSTDLPPAPVIAAGSMAHPTGPQPAGSHAHEGTPATEAPADSPLKIVHPGLLVRSPWNRTHFDDESMTELAESIKAIGVQQPVIVRPLPASRLEDTVADRIPGEPLPIYEIIAGERRWRATKLAGLNALPILVRDMTDEQVLLFQLVENLQREDLHPMEEAEGYERLMSQTEIRKEDIAAKVGKSRSYVYGRLNLLKLTAEVRTAFHAAKIDFSRALLISRIPDAALQSKALGEATRLDYRDEVPSYRTFQSWVQQNVMLRLDAARFKITQVDLVPDAGSCRECEHRTGANPDLFTDVDSADVCTDPKCFHAKEAAHDAIQLAAAKASGKKVIAGQAAKEVWPSKYTENLEGYVRLDKPDARTGTKKAVKTLLGKDAPETMVLVSPHTGEQVEVLPASTVNKLLKDKGHLTPLMARQTRQLSEHEVQQKLTTNYESTWRMRAIETVWREMNEGAAEGASDAFLRMLAKDLVSELRQDERSQVAKLLGLGKVATHEGIRAYLDDEDQCDGARAQHVLQLLAMLVDMKNIVTFGVSEAKAAPHIEQVAADYGVNVSAIQEDVKAEMKAEAAPTDKPVADEAPAKGKGGAKAAPKKTGKAEAAAGIAAALAAAESTPGPNDFKHDDRVRIRIDLARGKETVKAGTLGTIKVAASQRAWHVDLGTGKGMVKADYTNLEHAEDEQAPDLAKPALKASTRPVAKYRCPNTGATWTGRGKKPRWVEVALEDGKKLEDLAYTPADAAGGAHNDEERKEQPQAASSGAAALHPASAWPFPRTGDRA